MTSKRAAPASKNFPFQLSFGSLIQPLCLSPGTVFLDDLRSITVFSNYERISPLARSTDIDIVLRPLAMHYKSTELAHIFFSIHQGNHLLSMMPRHSML